MMRRLRRAGGRVFGGALMGVWVVLPLLPVLGALTTWWLGIH
jgi:hypothetical protein